jgi:SnoaL-like protein
MTITDTLTGVVAEYVAAVNAGDLDAIVGTFAEDAYINDARREFRGSDAIRRFIEKEIVGDNIVMDVREVLGHYGDTIVRAAYEGDFDRTFLPPGDVVLTNYFRVQDGKIVSLVTVNNRPAEY